MCKILDWILRRKKGYISDVKTFPKAIWTENFTPPTEKWTHITKYRNLIRIDRPQQVSNKDNRRTNK